MAANRDYEGSALSPIIKRWKENPRIDLMAELRDNNISLVYPVFIISNELVRGHDGTISNWTDYINENYSNLSFDNLSIPYSIYFIFLPVADAKIIKTQVISWIDSNRPLI